MRDILVATMILTSFMYAQTSSVQHKPNQHSVTSLADMIDRVRGCVVGMVDAYEDAPIMFAGSEDQGYGLTKKEDGTYMLRPLSSNSGVALIVPARYIVDLLDSKGIRFDLRKKMIPGKTGQ